MMCALVACGKEEKEKEEKEEYNEEQALEHDKKNCSSIKNCFNAAMCNEAAYKETVQESGSIIVSIDEDGEITFTSSGSYTNIEDELEISISDMNAPKEKGKSAYCISWDASNMVVSNIKVETVE